MCLGYLVGDIVTMTDTEHALSEVPALYCVVSVHLTPYRQAVSWSRVLSIPCLPFLSNYLTRFILE